MIPKIMHMIWIGDVSKKPVKWIESWKESHQSWDFRLYGNKELLHLPWRLKSQIQYLLKEKKYSGVADLMRYEILFEHGGIYVDADCECLHPLDDLLSYNAFAAYEHELGFPGLIANTVLGCNPGNEVIGSLIQHIERKRNPLRVGKRRYWVFGPREKKPVHVAIGPVALTNAIEQIGGFTILPSCSFYPYWNDGSMSPIEDERIYAHHHWSTSTGSYSKNYNDHPDIPVHIWRQYEAIEIALTDARKNNKDKSHIEALTAALWTVKNQQQKCEQ